MRNSLNWTIFLLATLLLIGIDRETNRAVM
jgi:hypothetical protein